jgi:hypothetical protein
MKTQILFISALLLLLVSSCTHIFYAPNLPNAPLLKNKGEVHVDGFWGGGSGINSAQQGSAAIAVTNKLGVYGSFYRGYGTGGNDSNSGHGYACDFGLGYFYGLTPKLRFELIGAVQAGNSKQKWANGYALHYTFLKPYVQANIGFRTKNFDLLLAQKIGSLSTDNLVQYNQGGVSLPAEVTTFMGSPNQLLYEPSIMIRGGVENVKAYLNLGFLVNLSNKSYSMATSVLGFGVHFTINTIPLK